MTRNRDGVAAGFLSNESGAVGSEFVVITAIVVTLGIGVATVVGSGAQGLTGRTAEDLQAPSDFLPARNFLTPTEEALIDASEALTSDSILTLFRVYSDPDRRSARELGQYVTYWSTVARPADTAPGASVLNRADEMQAREEARDHLRIAVAAAETRGIEMDDLSLAAFVPADYGFEPVAVVDAD